MPLFFHSKKGSSQIEGNAPDPTQELPPRVKQKKSAHHLPPLPAMKKTDSSKNLKLGDKNLYYNKLYIVIPSEELQSVMNPGSGGSIVLSNEAQIIEGGSLERGHSRGRPSEHSLRRLEDLVKIEPYIGKRSVKKIMRKLQGVPDLRAPPRENPKKSGSEGRSQQQS